MTKIYPTRNVTYLGKHAGTHQNGGTDELNVAGLSGELADAQPPKAHKANHQSGGGDAIKLDDLATPDDNTDLNASTTRHGLLKKLSNTASQFMNGVGNWVAVAWGDVSGKPSTFAPSTHASSHNAGGGDAITLETVALTNYSNSSSITGWSSFTTKDIFYKKIGKTVHVWYELAGTSNSTSVSFTLPYSNNASSRAMGAVRTTDSGTIQMSFAFMNKSSSTVSCYKEPGTATWTNSGTKAAWGYLVYEASE